MRHVLIINNEPSFISNLKQIINPKIHQFEIHFCKDTIDANICYKETQYDIIIYNENEVNNSHFYVVLNEKNIPTIQIVLCEMNDVDLQYKSSISKQFVALPCSPILLKEKIQKIVYSLMLIPDLNLRNQISNIKNLPRLPSLYIDINNELKSKNCSINSLSKIISIDFLMVSKLLKIVNSPFYSLRKEVTNINMAISYLGIDFIKTIIISSKLFEVNEFLNEKTLIKIFNENN